MSSTVTFACTQRSVMGLAPFVTPPFPSPKFPSSSLQYLFYFCALVYLEPRFLYVYQICGFLVLEPTGE
jgi:hypothetical protein